MKTLSVIIPVFNEERTIEKLLLRVAGVKLPANIRKEIVVVSDGSTDKTDEIISKLKITELKFLRHTRNSGKGAAVRTGLKGAAGSLFIIQDADLEYDPADYPKLLEPILRGKAEVVYGSRLVYYPLKLWGKNKTILPFHLIANKGLTWLTNLLYCSNLTDMETGYKLFKREILKKISLEARGFDFEPEITAKILNLKIPIVEVPINVTPRTYEEGKKIGFIDGLFAIWTLLKYRVVD